MNKGKEKGQGARPRPLESGSPPCATTTLGERSLSTISFYLLESTIGRDLQASNVVL